MTHLPLSFCSSSRISSISGVTTKSLPPAEIVHLPSPAETAACDDNFNFYAILSRITWHGLLSVQTMPGYASAYDFWHCCRADQLR